MSDPDPQQLSRLQSAVATMVQAGVAKSLADLQGALDRWSAGQLTALETHRAVLRHAARCERLVERVTTAIRETPASAIRDAVDAGLVSEDAFLELTGRGIAEVEPAHCLDLGDDADADKRAVVEEFLAKGPILVHIDSRRPDVAVPAHLTANPRLVLRFGYGLTPPIHDLTVDADGISGTLTFAGRPNLCRLPWASIYEVSRDGADDGAHWHEDAPIVGPSAERSAEAELRADSPNLPSPPLRKKPRPSHLKLVD